jgi:hypothetical protein
MGPVLYTTVVRVREGAFKVKRNIFRRRVPLGLYRIRIRYSARFQDLIAVAEAVRRSGKNTRTTVIIEKRFGDEAAFLKAERAHKDRLGNEIWEMLDQTRKIFDAAKEFVAGKLPADELRTCCRSSKDRIMKIQQENDNLPSHSFFHIGSMITTGVDGVAGATSLAIFRLSQLPDRLDKERKAIIDLATRSLQKAEDIALQLSEMLKYLPKSTAGSIDRLHSEIGALELPISEEKRETLRAILLQLAHELPRDEYGALNEISDMLDTDPPPIGELLKLIRGMRDRLASGKR